MSKVDKQSTNKAIAELLRSVAATYLLKNENRFRIMAYEKAADTVEHMTRELKDIWQEGRLIDLQKVEGIGPTISAHLDEYFSKGRSRHFDKVLKDMPKSVFVLMRVPGIGPKKAFKLVKNLKLLNPDNAVRALQYACIQGRVADMETFGEDSQKNILDAIALYEAGRSKTQRMPLPYALSLAEEVEEYLKKSPLIRQVDFLGSLRRRVATIGDIDIAIPSNGVDEDKIIDHFCKFHRAVSIDNKGERKASIVVSPNIKIDLRVQDKKTYGSMIQYFTGSKPHNVKLREYGLKKGLSLNEYGMKPLNKVHRSSFTVHRYNKEKNIYEFDSEDEFYEFLGLQYIPPEIREGTNEISIAEKKKLPHLVELKDIKGDFHIHSSYDLHPSHDLGANTYQEIVDKAVELGYEYVGFADHNPKTLELSEEEIIRIMKARKEHIDTKLDKIKIPYFIGLEVDITPNGEIALPAKAIEYVDYLIVSLHSAFRQPIKQMTERVLKALSYPKVRMFGHPTGRLLGKREGVDLDWEQIFAHVKKHDIALEINSGPDRLDLPDTLVREGLKHEIKYIINTDAHATEFMSGISYGVSVARRGWCTKHDIMNTRSYKKFTNWLVG